MRNVSWLLVLLVALSACQKNKNSGTPGAAGGQAAGVQIDGSVPADQQALIQKDFQIIASLPPMQATQEDYQMLGMSSFDGPSMMSMLHSRVKYIVGENYDYANEAERAGSTNGQPQVMNAMQVPDEVLTSNSLVTIMVNIGGVVYRVGKQYNSVYSLPIAGQNVLIDSPSVGVIQIGEGLFTDWRVKNTPVDSYANALIRFTVYDFHEGGHSLGNGAHVTFPHAKCPSDHDYAGNSACDQYSNGPYANEARALRIFRNSCTQCNNTELQTFKAFQADAQNRVLYGAQYRDPRPEKLVVR